MHLIDVLAILEIKRGKVDPQVKVLKTFNDQGLVGIRYAILSHCWIHEDEEVLFREMTAIAKMTMKDRAELQRRSGYQKIIKTCERAQEDGFRWAWVDTCCIDKDRGAELSESINSMYRWYANAAKCYAHLYDLQESALPAAPDENKFRATNGWPKWFSRGWTLQELIAPKQVYFFNAQWNLVGSRATLWRALSKITGIPCRILRYSLSSDRPCAAQMMSWAAKRTTMLEEDRAYSLLGLFKVYMPMLYGEGKNAFRRLQLEILRTTNDHSIFSWNVNFHTVSVLAGDPSSFSHCGDVVRMGHEEYREHIKQLIPQDQFKLISEEQFRTCSVTNGGIQIWLPISEHTDLPICEATLACRVNQAPVRIELALFESQYYRYSKTTVFDAPITFRQLFLAYETIDHDDVTFKLDDSMLCKEGFVQESHYADHRILGDNTWAVSNDLCTAISYLNRSTETGFALIIGSFLGHLLAHLAPFDPKSTTLQAVSYGMYQADAKEAQAIATLGRTAKKHIHLSNTGSVIRLTYQRLPGLNTHLLTLDTARCRGYCDKITWQKLNSIPIADSGVFCHVRKVTAEIPFDVLLVDDVPMTFLRTVTEPCELGDYGDWNHQTFKRQGNIFQQLTGFSLCPVEHVIRHPMRNHNVDYLKFGYEQLALPHPRCLSLPDDLRIKELLKSLSDRLTGKCLVTTIVNCSRVPRNAADPDHEKLHLSTPLYIPTEPLYWVDEECEK